MRRMKGLFIPGITAEMFRNGCLESIETLMAEGEIYDIDYSPWIPVSKQLPNKYDSGEASPKLEVVANILAYFGDFDKVRKAIGGMDLLKEGVAE